MLIRQDKQSYCAQVSEEGQYDAYLYRMQCTNYAIKYKRIISLCKVLSVSNFSFVHFKGRLNIVLGQPSPQVY